MSGGKVDDLRPLLFSVVHRIGRPAALPAEVADTHAAVSHQIAVPLVHTAPCVLLGGIDHFVRQGLDVLIFQYISSRPAPRLCQAGQGKDQLHGGAGATLLQEEYRLSSDGAKSQCAPKISSSGSEIHTVKMLASCSLG